MTIAAFALTFVAGLFVGGLCTALYTYHSLTTGKRGLRGFVITKATL